MGYNLPGCAYGGKGSIGEVSTRRKGLRNKRSAHRARLKKQEELKKMRLEMEREAAKRNDYDNPFDQFNCREYMQ